MGDDGFDWHGDDRDDADAGEQSTPDGVERREGDPTPGDDDAAGRPRSAAEPDSAGQDEAGASPDEVPTSGDETPGSGDGSSDPDAEGGSGESHVFGELVDRIEAASDRGAEAGDLRDLLPPDVAGDDAAGVNHLLERADGESGWRSRESSSVEPPDGLGDERPAVDSSPDGGPEPADDGAISGEGTPGSTDPVTGDDVDEDRSPPPGRSNPFEDLATRVATDTERQSLRDRIGTGGSVDRAAIPSDATNVLLVSSFDTDAAFERCLSLIGERPPEQTNLLFVWLSRDVGDRLARLYESYADPSTSVTVICRSEIGHLLRANPSIPTGDPGGGLTIERISDPRDLTKLGIAINRVTSEWRGRPKRPLMCFHSVTDLLQFEEHERVFRFLHVLGSRMNSVGATAYYHLDPNAHDPQTVATFRNLFDATVDLTAEGIDGDE